MVRRALTLGIVLLPSACRAGGTAAQPTPSSVPSSPFSDRAESEPARQNESPRLGGAMPTHHADWATLLRTLEGETSREDVARERLCEGRCSGPPPWLIGTKHRESADQEWRLVTPRRDHTLAVTPVIVALYDGICESRVEHEIEPDGFARKVVLHIVEQHIVSRRCPPSEELCDDGCIEVEWDCTLRVVPETLEMVIDSCTPPGPPPSLP